MKKPKKSSGLSTTLCYAPAYPYTGAELFQRLRVALADALGFQPSFRQLAEIIGEDISLTHYWFKALPQKHVIAFLVLLERLPEPKRWELVNACCRELPTIDHPRLAHDALAVAGMERLLHQSKGLTWIEGGTPYHRTFVIGALGHSFPRLCGPHASSSGLDVHEPRKLVPLEGVVYLREPMSVDGTKKMIMEKWPSIVSSKARLLLLNGVWLAVPELHQDILRLAANCHVVISVPTRPESLEMRGSAPSEINVISIGPPRERENWIRLTISAIWKGAK